MEEDQREDSSEAAAGYREAESEDLEFYDGGTYVNEDEENGQEEKERHCPTGENRL